MAGSTFNSAIDSKARVSYFAEAKISDGLSIHIKPAPVSKRIFAYLIDLSLVVAMLYVTVIVGMLSIGMISVMLTSAGVSSRTMNSVLNFVLLAFSLLDFIAVFHGYFWYSEYVHSTTIGKKAFGLKVTTLSGGRLSLFQCVVRDLARYIDCFLLVPGIFCISLTRRRRRLGDLMVQTMVTYSARSEAERNFMYMPRDRYLELRNLLDLQPIDRKDAESIVDYSFRSLVLRQGRSNGTETSLLDSLGPKIWNVEKAATLSRDVRLKLLAEHSHQLLAAKG